VGSTFLSISREKIEGGGEIRLVVLPYITMIPSLDRLAMLVEAISFR
jgi:hypothetical protein